MGIFLLNKIKYKIISKSSVELWYVNVNIRGNLDIPSEVSYLGNIYKVVSIGKSAFYGCQRLTSVTIPDGVTSIGNYAFWGCSNLISITMPNSVTSISSGAFYKCNNLVMITISSNVTYIGGDAFLGCNNLKTIYYNGNPGLLKDLPDNVNIVDLGYKPLSWNELIY